MNSVAIESNAPLFPSTEIMASFLSQEISTNAEVREKLVENAKDTILSVYNLDLSEYELEVVENSDIEVNIVLPCYSKVGKISAVSLDDECLGEVSGGEIIFSIIGFFTSIGAFIGAGIGVFGAGAGAGFATVIGVGASVGGATAAAVTVAAVAPPLAIGIGASAVAAAGVGVAAGGVAAGIGVGATSGK